MSRSVSTVVLDIEGTVSPLSVVHERLFPYARTRLADWIGRDDPEVRAVVTEVRAELGDPNADLATIADQLRLWSDTDVKAAPLKSLQGLIWAHGFTSGDLTAELYPDVPAAIDTWRGLGASLVIYSSGSELAQRLWFAHTQFGDLTDRIDGYFDTRSAGPKREADSYRTITTALGTAPTDTLFLSDAVAELDAARAAGWHTVGVSRERDGSPDVGDHPMVADLADPACYPGASRGVH